MKNLHLSLRKLPMILAVVVALIGMVLRVYPAVDGAESIQLDSDASQSVGSDYANLHQPTVSQLLPLLVGKNVRFTRIGGRREMLFSNPLSENDAAQLRSHYVATRLYDSSITGSPLTAEAIKAIQWLKGQRGDRLYVLFSDGLEDGKSGALNLPKNFAQGVRVLILFPRLENPRVAEALRLGGAQVSIARTPRQAQAALYQAVTGITPAIEMWRRASWWLLGAALLIALLGGVKYQWESEPTMPLPSFLEFESQDIQPKVSLRRTHELSVDLVATATINGQELKPVHRKLKCLADSIVVGRQGIGAHLSLPIDALGRDFDVEAEITPIDHMRIRVVNRGAVDILAGDKLLSTGEQGECRADGILSLGKVKLRLQLTPLVEGRLV